MTVLSALRNCLEGAVPSIIATCDNEGIPNVSYVSQVHYLDEHQVALTFQFFNKTHRNIRANPQATVYITDPDTAAQYRLAVLFIRTETEGPLYSALKAKLSGIADKTGMSDVFELKGVDIYRVLDIDCVLEGNIKLARPQPALLAQTRSLANSLLRCHSLDDLFEALVHHLSVDMAVARVSLLMLNEAGRVLYTIASNDSSGIGAEVPLGIGVAGVCALERAVIRIAFAASEYSYRNAIAHHSRGFDGDTELETDIPFPELEEPGSQLAVPLQTQQGLFAVLYLQSKQSRRFSYDDEDAFCTVAALFVSRYQYLSGTVPDNAISSISMPSKISSPDDGQPIGIKFYASNHSIFIDDQYLIKGVAGAILWRILQQYEESGREEFSNRELRLDNAIGLPEIASNLESRLILLRKRLQERTTDIAIEKSARGRFRLCVRRPVSLLEEAD